MLELKLDLFYHSISTLSFIYYNTTIAIYNILNIRISASDGLSSTTCAHLEGSKKLEVPVHAIILLLC